MKSSTADLALLLLSTAPFGCNFADKVCVGDCPETSGPTTSMTMAGDESGGVGETGVVDVVDPTTEGGIPNDPPPTCELTDTLLASDTCLDTTLQPGELCFVLGSGTLSMPGGVVSAIAAPLEGGGTDMLVTHEDGGVTAVLYSPGEGVVTSSKKWPQTFPEGPLQLLAVADFNEDGFADVVARIDGIEGGFILLFLLDGEGGLLEGRNLATGEVTGADLWDANGDDHQDLLVTHLPDQGLMLLGDGDGQFESTPGLQQQFITDLHATGAIGEDGVHDDLVMVGDSVMQILMQTPDFGFLRTVDLAPTNLVHALRILDLQGDGLGDVVALIEDTDTHTSELAVITQSLDLGLEPVFTPTRYTVHCGAVALAVGDIDGDGAPDLATASPDVPDSRLTIRRNDGQGGFSDVLTLQAGGPIDELFIVDLNADGAADFATASRAAGTVGVVPSTP